MHIRKRFRYGIILLSFAFSFRSNNSLKRAYGIRMPRHSFYPHITQCNPVTNNTDSRRQFRLGLHLRPLHKRAQFYLISGVAVGRSGSKLVDWQGIVSLGSDRELLFAAVFSNVFSTLPVFIFAYFARIIAEQ